MRTGRIDLSIELGISSRSRCRDVIGIELLDSRKFVIIGGRDDIVLVCEPLDNGLLDVSFQQERYVSAKERNSIMRSVFSVLSMLSQMERSSSDSVEKEMFFSIIAGVDLPFYDYLSMLPKACAAGLHDLCRFFPAIRSKVKECSLYGCWIVETYESLKSEDRYSEYVEFQEWLSGEQNSKSILKRMGLPVLPSSWKILKNISSFSDSYVFGDAAGEYMRGTCLIEGDGYTTRMEECYCLSGLVYHPMDGLVRNGEIEENGLYGDIIRFLRECLCKRSLHQYFCQHLEDLSLQLIVDLSSMKQKCDGHEVDGVTLMNVLTGKGPWRKLGNGREQRRTYFSDIVDMLESLKRQEADNYGRLYAMFKKSRSCSKMIKLHDQLTVLRNLYLLEQEEEKLDETLCLLIELPEVNSDWAVRQLCSRRELVLEGCSMKHCVANYAERVGKGEYLIFSISGDVERMTLGLEVLETEIRYHQLVGFANKAIDLDTELSVRKWVECLNGGHLSRAEL